MEPSLGRERAKYITSVVLYGTIGMFLRYVSLPSELVAMCRGILGSIFILAFLAFRHTKPDGKAIKKNLKWLIISGICLGLNWIFLFAAYMETTVAIASLCNYMAPLIVIVVAPLVLHEKLEVRKLPCVLAALIGIILVSGVTEGGNGNPLGIVFGLSAAVCFVIIVICNRNLKDISSYDRSIVQLALSAVTILPYFIIHNLGKELYVSPGSIPIVLILGLLHTGVAYCLYFSGMATLPVQTVAVLGYIEPVVAVLCSAIFLAEPMTVSGWIGAVLIIAAAVVSELIPSKAATATQGH